MSAPAEAMRATHGPGPEGRRCGECAFCTSRDRPHPTRGTVVERICRKAPVVVTAKHAERRTRWLARWPTCGLFREPE